MRFVHIVLLAAASFSAVSVNAQGVVLEGWVKDPQERPIQGAELTLSRPSTTEEWSTRSNAEGYYRFAGLEPGRYRVEASKEGFHSRAFSHTLITSQLPHRMTIALVLATVKGEIVVSSSMPELFTEVDITGRELTEAGARDVAEFLRGTSGLSAVRRGTINLEPTIRGLQENQVAMFVDGTRTFAAGPARMDSDISHVNPHAVENVRVIKGPYALTWGAGTLSALQIETHQPPLGDDDVRAELHLGYGENAERGDVFGSVWHGHDKWSWRLNMGYREGGDYEAGDGSTVPGDYESAFADLSWIVQASPDVLFTAKSTWQDQDDLDYPGRLLDATLFETLNHKMDVTWNRPDSAGASFGLSEIYGQVYANRKDHRMNNDEKPTARPAPERVPPFALRIDLPTESDTTGGRLRFGLAGENVTAALGADVYRLEQNAERFIFRRENDVLLFRDIVWPDAEIDDLGLYAQATWSVGKAQIGAAVRVDEVDASAGEVSDFFRANVDGDLDQNETNFSAALNALVEIDGHWTFNAGLGQAVRTATPLERYSDRFPSTKFQIAAEFMGNPELEPEESRELNLGLRGRYGGLLIELDAFYREIDDYITVAPDPDLPKRLPLSPPTVFRYVNGEGANFYGGEFLLNHRTSERFSWRAALEYVWAKDEEFNEPVLGIAPLSGLFGVRYHGLEQKLWVDLAARFADRQDRVATARFERATPGYTVYDLTAQYEIRDGLMLRGGIENLTDKAYAHHLNSPNPFTRQRILEIGRSFRFGLTYRFSKRPPTF